MENTLHSARAQSFKGFEGLRAWLAWTVLIGHIASLSPYKGHGLASVLSKAGDFAVIIFIIISGFVITNLVLTKKEPYVTYIARRAVRIYPPYLIGLAMGVFVMAYPIDITGFWQMPAKQMATFAEQKMQFDTAANTHLGWHLSLLHSMLPSEILPQSEHMFLSPAWSLSLEWQFYLIAPIFIIAIQRYPAAMALMGLIGLICFKAHVLGHYFRAGLVLSSAWYFMIGTATRLHIDRLPQFARYPWWLFISAVPLVLLSKGELAPILIWFGLVLYLRSPSRWACLDSRLARLAGERSYAVYILHMPMLMTAIWISWGHLSLSGPAAIAATAAIIIPCTLAAAEIVYRFVERPAIQWGRSIGTGGTLSQAMPVPQ